MDHNVLEDQQTVQFILQVQVQLGEQPTNKSELTMRCNCPTLLEVSLPQCSFQDYV